MGQRPLDVRGQGFRVEVTLVPLLGHRGGTHRIEFPRDRAIDVTRSRRGGFADALEEVVDRETRREMFNRYAIGVRGLRGGVWLVSVVWLLRPRRWRWG